MSANSAVFQRYDDDILRSAVWTGTAPSTSYSLSTLGSKDPASRVRWGATGITATATIASAQGDTFVLPMHNLTPGSTTVVKVTNNNGFDSGFLTVPALQVNGFPPTLIADLTGLASAATRTATVWNVIVVGNAANVTLGGAVLIYGTRRSFVSYAGGDDFSIEGYVEREQHAIRERQNEYLTRYIVDYGAVTRSIDVRIAANATGLPQFRNWYRGCHGRGLPGFFWPDPTVADGYFGVWQPEFRVDHMLNTVHWIDLTFDELAKGQAL